MKRIFTTLDAIFAITHFSYSQNSNPWPTSGAVGIGTSTPSSLLHVVGGGLTLGTNSIITNTDGGLSIRNTNGIYVPTTSNWSTTGSTILLNAGRYSTIGFHHSGLRVDVIKSGFGTIQLGYNGGWGEANIGLPGSGIWNTSGNVGVGTLTPDRSLVVNGSTGGGAADAAYHGTVRFDDTTPLAADNGGGATFGYTYTGTTQTYGPFIRGYKFNSTDANVASGLKLGVRGVSGAPLRQ